MWGGLNVFVVFAITEVFGNQCQHHFFRGVRAKARLELFENNEKWESEHDCLKHYTSEERVVPKGGQRPGIFQMQKFWDYFWLKGESVNWEIGVED